MPPFSNNSIEMGCHSNSDSTPIDPFKPKGATSSSPSRLSVKFAPTSEDQTRIITPQNSPDDIKNIWSSREELDGFKKDCAITVQLIMIAKRLDCENFCPRGLEHMSRAGSLQLKSRRRYSQSVILEEQKKQRFVGRVDEEEISRVYKEATRRSIVSAIAQGTSDAKALR
jgi:hypothetical protein